MGRDGFPHFRQTRKHKSRIPCPILGESRFPGNSQIPDHVNISIVFPIPAPYFGKIPNPENTLPDPLFGVRLFILLGQGTRPHKTAGKTMIQLDNRIEWQRVLCKAVNLNNLTLYPSKVRIITRIILYHGWRTNYFFRILSQNFSGIFVWVHIWNFKIDMATFNVWREPVKTPH